MRTEAPYSRSAKKETWTARNIVPAARLQPERYFYSICMAADREITRPYSSATQQHGSNMGNARDGFTIWKGELVRGTEVPASGVRGKPPHHVHYDHMDDDSDIE